jgi:hypothetical protein
MPFYTKEGENTTQIYSEIKKKRKLKNFSRRVYAELEPVPHPQNPKLETLQVKLKTYTDVPYRHQFRYIKTIPDSWENKDGFHEPYFGIPIEGEPDWRIFDISIASFVIKNSDTKELEAVVIYSSKPMK